MRRPQAILSGVVLALFTLAFAACPNSIEPPLAPPQEATTGSIAGWALFSQGEDNGGIMITLEETIGPRSASVIRAGQGTGGGPAPVVAVTQTDTDGSFAFGDIPPGTYTLHASSRGSLERAVAINVTVRANTVSSVGTLSLTPVGSISGRITVDGYGSPGFIVSVAGTSFMAVTGEGGTFTIGGVPAGTHRLIVVRGNFTAFFAQRANVSGGTDVELRPKNITGTALSNAPRIGPNGNWWVGERDLGVRIQGEDGEVPHVGENGNWWIGDRDLGVRAQGLLGVSIVWKGELDSAPPAPQPNWAYFDTTNRNAWIWNAGEGDWDLLSEHGKAGADGEDGIGIVWLDEFDSHTASGLANPQVNWAFHNTTSRRSYIFDGYAWQVLARDGPQVDGPIGFVPVESVTLNNSRPLFLYGESRALAATVVPGNATITTLLWSSSDTDIATVDMFTGRITAHREGTAKITATSLYGGRAATSSISVISTGLPVLHIETENATTIDSREIWTNMTGFRITSDNPEYRLERTAAGRDEIRGRGNTTWGWPKRPYRIRFRDSISLFGLAPARNWVLLANWNDFTLLNATVAFELGRRLDLPFTPNAIHVEVILNGVHQGSYVLTEHMRVAPGRVDVGSNGWLVELDTHFDDDVRFRTNDMNLPVMVKHPDFGGTGYDPAYEFIRNDLNAFATALYTRDFAKLWSLVDMYNFVDWIMLNEIVANWELGHPKSVFAHRHIDATGAEKMRMGHIWDFDWAFAMGGNPSVNIDNYRSRVRGGVFRGVFDDPNFVARYVERWNEMHSDIASMPTFIGEMYDKLRLSASLDSSLWRENNYAYEVGRLTTWWTRRVAWLHEVINNGQFF